MRKPLLAVLLLSIACTSPLCGCSPERFAVLMRGTLRDAGSAPLGGVFRIKGTESPWDTVTVALTLAPAVR